MEYRKLSESEIKKLFTELKGHFEYWEKCAGLIALVKKYFIGAKKVLVNMDSEYNDEYYTHEIISVFVYGKDDVELSLTYDSRRAFQQELESLYIDFPTTEDDPIEDFVLHLDNALISLYVEAK